MRPRHNVVSANRNQSDTKDRLNNMSAQKRRKKNIRRGIVVDTTENLIESHRQSFSSVRVPRYRFIEIIRIRDVWPLFGIAHALFAQTNANAANSSVKSSCCNSASRRPSEYHRREYKFSVRTRQKKRRNTSSQTIFPQRMIKWFVCARVFELFSLFLVS